MKKILVLAALFLVNTAFPQRNDTQAAVYNIGFSSLASGIGAVINKKDGESTGAVFLKGLAQGALGGYVIFESKRLSRLIYRNNEPGFAWPSKIVNAAGTSMVENAAANINFWEKWHMNYGFSRIELNVKDGLSVRYKVMPVSFAYTVGQAITSRFEPGKTLRYGQFIFSDRMENYQQGYIDAVTYPGVIVYRPGAYGFNSLMTHEIIHIYQQNDFNAFNTYLNKVYTYAGNNSGFIKGLNKWVHYDFNQPLLYVPFLMENKNRVYYYDNYFEHEAGYYSNTLSNALYNP